MLLHPTKNVICWIPIIQLAFMYLCRVLLCISIVICMKGSQNCCRCKVREVHTYRTVKRIIELQFSVPFIFDKKKTHLFPVHSGT